MPFHLELLCGATLMPLIEDVRWTGTEHNSEGGWKLQSGFKPFLDQSSRNFWTSRRCFVLSNVIAQLSMLFSFRWYSPSSLEVVEKPNKCTSFLPSFYRMSGQTQLFYRRLLALFAVHRLTQFGWVLFADYLSVKPGNEVERFYVGVKWRSSSKPFVDQSSCFWDDV